MTLTETLGYRNEAHTNDDSVQCYSVAAAHKVRYQSVALSGPITPKRHCLQLKETVRKQRDEAVIVCTLLNLKLSLLLKRKPYKEPAFHLGSKML
jgi:hypothetical protein